MKKTGLFVLTLLLLWFPLYAQSNPEWNAAQIKESLEKLNTVGRVLYVAAHPDDENTQLLAWLANDQKYRTAYLALTRGDGGQNLVGDEQGPFLGLIRTEELLAARHNDGAEQFFSHALDFGFSKTAKETFQFWGHERILRDVVWIVRKFRPDIIICRFPEDKRAGHGNHWASAILAHEAFKAAADSTRFPEQLRYVKTWQARRILWNTYNFGNTHTTASDQFKINIGGYNPLLGKGYGEIAARSRSMHKSQGFGSAPSYGTHWEYFKTIEGSTPKQRLMDGVNTTWARVDGGEAVSTLIQQALKEYDASHPAEITPLLLKIKAAIHRISDTVLRDQKEKEVNKLILACNGILLNAYSSQPYIVAGQKLKVQTVAINRGDQPVVLKSVTVAGQEKPVSEKLTEEVPNKNNYEIQVPRDIPISQPYWLIKKPAAGYYKISNPLLVGKPEPPPSLTVQYDLNIGHQPLKVTRQILYKYTDPVRGAVTDPLVVTPPATANIQNEVYVFTDQTPQEVEVRLKSYEENVEGTAHLEAPGPFTVQNNDQAFSLKRSGDEKIVHFTLSPSHPVKQSLSDTLAVHLKINGKTYDRGIKVIALNYIPTITVFPFAEAKIAAVPLKKGGSGDQIGYIMGPGDKVPDALEQIGYHVKLLSDRQLHSMDLQQFDAIVVGIRAYNTRKDLRYVQRRLMQYVKSGGTMVVQYNKNFDLVTDSIGPYPFKVTRDRVTDETAKVAFLLPQDPVLNIPNKITETDFDGWIQERGLYFVDQADPHYRKPLAMHDPGEAPLDGSLIVCNYGKGKYVYTSLDFFRDLPAGVPGAFRLFVNLIAGRNKVQK